MSLVGAINISTALNNLALTAGIAAAQSRIQRFVAGVEKAGVGVARFSGGIAAVGGAAASLAGVVLSPITQPIAKGLAAAQAQVAAGAKRMIVPLREGYVLLGQETLRGFQGVSARVRGMADSITARLAAGRSRVSAAAGRMLDPIAARTAAARARVLGALAPLVPGIRSYFARVSAESKKFTGVLTTQLARLRVPLAGLGKSLLRLPGGFLALGRSMGAAAKSAMTLGGVLSPVMAPIMALAGVGKMFSTATAIEDQSIILGNSAGVTGDAIRALQDEIVGLGTEMRGIRTDKLMDIATAGAKMGVPVSQLKEYTATIAKLSMAMDDIEPGEIADAMGKLAMGIFKVDAIEGAKSIGSAIDELADNFATKGSTIIDVMTRMGGTAHSMGITADQTAAMAAALTATGVSAERAGSGLEKMLGKMLSSNKHANFAKVMGISTAEFAAMVKDKPMEAVNGFLESVSKLDAAQQRLAIQSVGIGGLNIGITQKLAGNIDEVSRALGIAAHQYETQEKVERAYASHSEKLSAKWDQTVNKLTAMAVSGGDVLMPLASRLLDWVMPIIDGIQSLLRDARTGITDTFRRFGEAFGGAVSGAGSWMARLRAWWGDTFEGILFTLRNLPALFEMAFLTSYQSVSNFFTRVGAHFSWFGQIGKWAIDNFVDIVIDGFKAALSVVTNFAKNWKDLAGAVVGWLANPTGGFNFEFTPLLDGFESTLSELPKYVEPAFLDLSDRIGEIGNRIAENEAARTAQKMADAAQAAAEAAAQGAVDTLEDAAEKVAAKTNLAGALYHGSAEARSLLLNHRQGAGDEQVRIGRDQLRVQRDLLAEARRNRKQPINVVEFA